MRSILGLIVISLTIISFGCKKKASIPDPSPAVLLSPANNEACTTGTIVSDTESKITLNWNAGANVDSYQVTIINLLNQGQQTLSTTTNSAELSLQRNTPYSWFVTSKSSKSAVTAKSTIWKFYNPGLGTSSYPPYPAEMVSPTMGQSVIPNAGKITLQWKGSDADNDLVNYDVYLGTSSNNVTAIKTQHAATSLMDVSVNANSVYYWKVISRDGKGNTSDSGLHEFKIN
jgi:hypothetical protein